MRDVILTDRVPVSLSAVAVLGLPYCGKSQVLKKLFKSEIRLKEQFDTGQVAERIKHFEQDRGLSLYPLCVLGGQPHTKYSWSFTSRRYGIAYSVITSVIRRFGVFNLKSIQFSKETSKGVFDDKHLNSHLQWVLDEVEQLLSSIEDQADKIDLLANGFTLVNVFDAGVNKAVYDFLPYLANACDNLVRLVFFSMERDSEHFYDESEPELAYEKYKERNDHRFVMRLRPRMSYLMHFASLGFQPNVPVTEGNTVFIGTWQKNDSVPQQSKQAFTEDTKKKIFQASKAASFRWINEKKHWVEVNVDEPQSLREGCLKIEQLIAQNSAFTCYLPVKWVFLRSLLSSFSVASTSTKVSPVIIEKKEVIMRASFLKMEGEEVDEFLRKFANYGSLVHFPDFEKLAAIVIVDVSKFVQLLSKLYYPVESDELHRKYGILTQKMLTNLVGDPDSIQPHTFMMIVTELGMASTIKDSSMIVIPNKPKLDCGTCYFIPSARTGTEGEERQSNAESLFIHVDCVQFPANVQASIANSIINVNGMCMIACEFSDVLFFESNDGNIKLRIKYRGKKTELTLEKPITVEKKIIKALSDILGACCNALTERRQQIRDLLFNIGLECQQEGKTTYHYLFYNTDPDLCEKCKKIYQQSEIMQLWGAAAKKVRTFPRFRIRKQTKTHNRTFNRLCSLKYLSSIDFCAIFFHK